MFGGSYEPLEENVPIMPYSGAQSLPVPFTHIDISNLTIFLRETIQFLKQTKINIRNRVPVL
jgi:hypothetical protein